MSSKICLNERKNEIPVRIIYPEDSQKPNLTISERKLDEILGDFRSKVSWLKQMNPAREIIIDSLLSSFNKVNINILSARNFNDFINELSQLLNSTIKSQSDPFVFAQA